jgi:hypothetical protein
MKRLALLILIILFSFSACKKESKLLYASIRDGGDIALDGCGWLIEISSETFSPINLPDEFKVDGMEVEIKYERLDSMADCGLSQDVYYEINLTEIQEFN